MSGAPSVSPTVRVAAVISQTGAIRFTLPDQDSIRTAADEMKALVSEEQMEKHQKYRTIGGVVILTMLAEDWHKMSKRFDP